MRLWMPLLGIILVCRAIDIPILPNEDGKPQVVDLSEEHSVELLQHWLDQAVSGLMAAVATKKLRDVSDKTKDAHQLCSEKANTVQSHAKCVVSLIDERDRLIKRRLRAEEKMMKYTRHLPLAMRRKKLKDQRSYLHFGNTKVSSSLPPSTTPSPSSPSSSSFSPASIIDSLTTSSASPLRKRHRVDSSKWKKKKGLKIRKRKHRIATTTMTSTTSTEPSLSSTMSETTTTSSTASTSRAATTLSDFDLLDEEDRNLILTELRRVDMETTTTTTPSTPFGLDSGDVKPGTLDEWFGSFRMRSKRDVVSRDSYTLHSAPDALSPFSHIAKHLTESVRKIKNKKEKAKSWHSVIDEIQDEAKKMKAKRTIRKLFAKRLAMMQEKTANGTIDERRPLAMKDFDMLDEDDPKALLAEARRLEKGMSEEDRAFRAPLKLIREAVRLGMMVGGKNVSGIADKTLKLVSPRLMSVVPEEDNDDVNLLSPSLFSLHREGKGIERMTSLADGFGLVKNSDHEEWLNFVMEASGVVDAVEYLKEEKIKKATLIDEEELKTPSGQPLYFTKENVTKLYGDPEKRKIEIFEELQASFTPEQIAEQQESGFFIMTPAQLKIVYGPRSPYNSTERLTTLSSINSSSLPSHIDSNIRAISNMSSFSIRQKDVILTPVLFTPLVFQSALLSGPIILSPLVFSPSILSPAVLGPVVLGPWVFIPVILSPRVLSPLILNPLIFSPIVLSPLVLHPLILSPGVFNPIVLSPLVLSPFILSPQVFTPLILSPFVLNPLILNPMVGSPLILSPFVLSPIIMSPQALFAVVLSPYAMSPIIQSDLGGAEVILSPSWLS